MDVENALKALLRRALREADESNTRVHPERQVIELASSGPDEYLQGVGTDPFRSLNRIGMRVPALVTSPRARYLFQLCTINVSVGQRIRVLGVKQMLKLGVVQAVSPRFGAVGVTPPATRVVELNVETPDFRMPDGANASWHLMRVPIMKHAPNLPTDSTSFVFRRARAGSALLYETATFPAANVNAQGMPDFYTSMTAYTPPNAGRPYGTPLLPTVHEIRWPLNKPASASALRLEVTGECQVVLYASVQQSTGDNAPFNSNDSALGLLGVSPEEAFIAQFAGVTGSTPVQFYSVGGAIHYEDI